MDTPSILDQLIEGNLPATEYENKREHLILFINELLVHDFHKLVLLLYRVDIDEKKLRLSLQQNKEVEAAHLITDLILKKMEEKKESKKKFWSADDIPENDKW